MALTRLPCQCHQLAVSFPSLVEAVEVVVMMVVVELKEV